MAEVTFTNVVKRYGQVEVVKGLSLDVADGEFLVLVGASGCGKSTTLRLLAGLETADSGDIKIGNRRVNDLAPKDRDIAMVFQNYALYPHMTVADNIGFALKLRKVAKAEIKRRVDESAAMLDIVHLLNRKPKGLSGGQRQRVALGRALVREPQCFLMDEPLSNLDAKLRAQTRTEIKKLHQRIKTTTLYVTHDQVEAMTMGDRMAVMKDGLIQQLATPKETYEFPKNRFVAGFIGSPSMNQIPIGAGEIGDGWLPVHHDGFSLKLPVGGLDLSRMDKAILGIRPEHLFLFPTADQAQISGILDVIEPSGSRTVLHLTAAGNTLVAEVDTALISDLRIGQTLALGVQTDRLHLFDAVSDITVLSTQRAFPQAVGR
ncbi:MAG: sn-glycerol-3-phosphate ABC transporter ATP-binding protein UgpC [Candidatus Sericytochromatia bacterium]|nr:sn-glycerol-3-phosphate ABC transporter ATP-binding protein UgpC [Candidatus Sericytochromatia bacterium]